MRAPWLNRRPFRGLWCVFMFKSFFKGIKKLQGEKVISIRKRLMLNYSILICFLVVIIVIINLFITSDILMDKIGNYVLQTISETREKIDSSMIKIEIAANILNNNSQIQRLVIAEKEKDGATSAVEDIDSVLGRDNIRQSLNDVINVVGDIYAIRVYFNENDALSFRGIRFIHEGQQPNVKSALAVLDRSKSNYVWVSPYTYNKKKVFSLAKRFINTVLLEKIGYILVDVDVRYLHNILTEGQTDVLKSIYLIDRQEDIIGSGDNENYIEKLSPPLFKNMMDTENGTFTTTIDGIPMLVAYSTSAYTGWKVVGMVPLDRLNSDILENQTIIILIGILGLAFSFTVSALIAASITRPINHLRAVMRKIEKGSMQVDIAKSSFVETEELADGFKRMLEKSRELYTRAYTNELRKKEAEFKALQAQINPHFLYNTLETLNYMLIIDEKYDMSRIVTNLGDILRYSINKGNDIITLEQDLQQIEKYLYIQKMRFGEKLNYQFDIQEETKQCLMLKLLIQPLVENAICHGIETKRGRGMLHISSAIEDGRLLISIEDNGVGMPAEAIEKVLSGDISTEDAETHTRLGISNINHRMKIFYGEAYGLDIKSEVGKGTCVMLCLPAVRKD